MGGAAYQGASGGASAFTDLTDTPTSYTGQASKAVAVNAGATGLEFIDIPASVFYGASPAFINAEQARSDIRSTTRTGYSTFNSAPGLQTLLNSVSPYTTIYLPSNGRFDLNGTDITTTVVGTCLMSTGAGALIANGGIVVGATYTKLTSLRLTEGSTTYGIKINDGTHYGNYDSITISNKTYGVYLGNGASYSIYNKFHRFDIRNYSAAGFYINFSGVPTGDAGDVFITHSTIETGTGYGMHIVKCGGLNLTGCKIQNAGSGGILFEPTSNTTTFPPVWGNYITGCAFEDCTGFDIKMTAGAAVSAAKYPQRIQIVGGTIHKLVLDKCKDISVIGVLTPISVTLNAEATNIMAIGCPAFRGLHSGASTSYLDIGHDSVKGAYIATGGRLTLIDSTGEKYL